jgi:hypothetical protein
MVIIYINEGGRYMFYTPGGLRIRLPINEGFSLIARIHPIRRGIDVLRTTDGLDKFPAFFTNLVVLVLLGLKLSLWMVIVGAVLSVIVSTLIVIFGAFSGITSNTWRLHKIMPDVIRWVVVYGLTYWIFGFNGVKTIFFALLVAYLINIILEFLIASVFKLTISELEFFRAFQYHAKKLAIDSTVPATENEIESERWLAPLIEYTSVVPTGIPQEQQQMISDAVNHTLN